MTNAPKKPQQRGASLLEILVAVLIVTFGIMSMLALQATSVKFNKTSELRSVATLLAKDMADRMRANRAGVIALNYDLQPSDHEAGVAATSNGATASDAQATAASCSLTDCTASQMAATDLSQWQRNLFFGLPKAAAYVRYDATASAAGAPYADLWVVWDDATGNAGGGAGIAPGATSCPPWSGTGTYSCVYYRVAL